MKRKINPQRWKTIDELLGAAMDMDPDKRSTYLDQACGTDKNLRVEVETLLAAEQRTDNFIALPVLDPGSKYLPQEIELQERDIVAERYELISRLGSGGLGEVWRAFDLKLRVDVALKTLRFHLDRSPHRVEDLRREIRHARDVISPNVCRIFDLVVDNDRDFILMEYIDGITLSFLLQNIGPIQFNKARDIAAQFLAGLQAVHEAGLVHCDLKPENIMITLAGRVVVMDFGIAKEIAQARSTISGTPAYMSPEQLSGAPVDARADIFAVGIILAEMIYPERIVTEQTREEIWNAVRQNPPQLSDSPWKSVISRAVAPYANDRFPSAAELLRALEEVTDRMKTLKQRSPYPGLASFTAADAEHFFGREQEVETLIKKLKELYLTALVGPSGSGKTSFLRAGLIPALPNGWKSIFCVPGDSPQFNLQQALIPEFSGDPEAMHKMLQFDNRDVALQLLNQWRKKYDEVVLIIDRFEELFTLNGADIQSRFAELIGTAAVESDVRVLLCMRDDFLVRCHHYSPLAPIFSGLTPLESLTGPALRRALVQPALKCGYRFEEETLVEEILADVEKERGALPLMAFAAAQLWKKRDRQSGELSRRSYHQISGVAGALARHAEETMDRIGQKRTDIVREIFRNLITAQNTRIARDIDELLSVFPNQPVAKEVLGTLIDARLLTSFETALVDGEKPKRRVEFIHESLLSAWPRLVRWQTKDADSAQLRDQLRQAAQVWEQRNRSEDLLWTGTAFVEFRAWQELYRGRLTTTEEAFAQAMSVRENKKRKQLRLALVATFVILLSVIALIVNFWHGERVAKESAVSEAKRAEAGKVLVLGRTDPSEDNSVKLAYALASIELSDTNEGRHFALQSLSKAPPARIRKAPMRPVTVPIEFSPNGKWMVAGGIEGVQLLPSDGGAPLILSDYRAKPLKVPEWPGFSADGDLVIWLEGEDRTVATVWSLSQRQVVRNFHFEGYTSLRIRNGRAIFNTDTTRREWRPKWGPGRILFRIWNFDRQEPQVVADFNTEGIKGSWDIERNAKWITYGKGNGLYLQPLEPSENRDEKLIGRHASEIKTVKVRPGRNEIASLDNEGELRIWSVTPAVQNPLRVIPASSREENRQDFWFDPKGDLLVIASDSAIHRFDLTAPFDHEPPVIRYLNEEPSWVSFDQKAGWMAVSWETVLAFYPMTHTYPYIYSDSAGGSFNVRFTPDGMSLVYGLDSDGIRIWNISDKNQPFTRALWQPPHGHILPIDIDPHGRYVLAGTNAEKAAEGIYLISMADGKFKSLKRCLPGRIYDSVTFSPDGKFAAAVAVHGAPEKHGIEIWNVQSGDCRVIEQSRRKASFCLKYSPDGSLFSGDTRGNLYQWNLTENSNKAWHVGKGIVTGIAITNDGRYLAAVSVSAKEWDDVLNSTSEFVILDLTQDKISRITSHGNRLFSVAFDPFGTKLITGDLDGNVRVGSITGESPHVLIGHESHVGDVAVDPTGRWIASIGFNKAEVRLWPMPEGEPFHRLPYGTILNRLRAFTNTRVIADKNSSSGYRIEYAPFSGWENPPTW